MNYKQHKKPEFQVIKQNEANVKFFVASSLSSGPVATSVGITSTNDWF